MDNTKLKQNIINLEEVAKSGESKLFKSLPKFLLRKIIKIIHQDKYNEIHSKYWNIVGLGYVEGLIKEFGLKFKIIGFEKIPKDGRFVYVANHPQGGLDAISFLYLIHQHHGDVVSPSNEVFEFIPNLSPFIIGVNVFGHNTKEKAKAVNDAFAGNRPIMIFPAGEVSRKGKNGIIEDTEWYKTFVTKSIEHKRTIVPVFITGRNSEKFYRISRIRKFFGIKAYIETLYLPDEMVKQFNSEITFIAGEPIPYDKLDKSISHSDWAVKIRNIVYNLGKTIKLK